MGNTAKGAVIFTENAGASTTAWKSFAGGPALFMAQATWGGGSAKLQGKLPNATAYDIATLSADGVSSLLYLPCGEYRVVVATSTACYSKIVHVPI